MYYIVRNNKQYGPYSIDNLKTYVESGQILTCDTAIEQTNPAVKKSVGYFLRKGKVMYKIPRAGNIFKQFKAIGTELVFPKTAFNTKQWIADKNILALALIGLVPLLIGTILGSGLIMFYTVSLYFSVIWGLFFYYLFKTPQVKLKTTLIIFFGTQAFVFLFFGLGLAHVNPLYSLGESENFIVRLLFFVFAVGITEEFVKSISLHIIAFRASEPIIPQTLLFYGLISGIAFGVFEGVEYQMGVNAQCEYGESFFLNIARLTSLPFLHAVWCAIAGYFIAFAKLYPKYRLSLYALSICIPALLHGLYDTFGILISLPIAFVSVALLMTYLKQGVNYQSKLSH